MLFTLKKISKEYGKKDNVFHALRDVSFEVQNGESLGIIGKSGSGKSTLMHIMATLDSPTSGTLLYKGDDLSTQSLKQLDSLRNKEFGFVFQQFFLNPNDTVIENVALPLKLVGVGKTVRNERALAVLEQVDLADKAGNKATDLSGGQKQRACIARALVGSPRVIFADEPTGNLDSESGRLVIDAIFDLNKTKGITLILVTHDSDLAAKCLRQIKIKDGQLA